MKVLFIPIDLSFIDQHTLVITIAGYCIVLAALALIAYSFLWLQRLMNLITTSQSRKESPKEEESRKKTVISGEENAAIATALYLFFSELHDEEKYVMTIRKVSKTYSPWNSKIYGILNMMKQR